MPWRQGCNNRIAKTDVREALTFLKVYLSQQRVEDMLKELGFEALETLSMEQWENGLVVTRFQATDLACPAHPPPLPHMWAGPDCFLAGRSTWTLLRPTSGGRRRGCTLGSPRPWTARGC